MRKILLTGAKGVVGTATEKFFQSNGWAVRPLDTANAPGEPGYGDILNLVGLEEAIADCDGVVHMAAVSRVHWCEADPSTCLNVNVSGTRNVIEAALASRRKPWVLFVSSREVYGNPASIPVQEDHPLAPINCYGRSKAEGERLALAARQAGARIGIVRLANVYGTARDYSDRAAPSFAQRAIAGQSLVVTGGERVFDFVHLNDTVEGIWRMAKLLAAGADNLAPVHLVSGRPTSLFDLAQLALRLAQSHAPIVESGPRQCDPTGFVGDPSRAEFLLGWKTAISIECGMAELIAAFENISSQIGSGCATPEGLPRAI